MDHLLMIYDDLSFWKMMSSHTLNYQTVYNGVDQGSGNSGKIRPVIDWNLWD